MEHPTHTKVADLLKQLQAGNRDVIDELFSLVYDELHSMARAQRLDWQGDYTLNTTGLVHEVYLKLVDQSRSVWQTPAHFLSVAAKAMRHILVDYARRRQAEKRGGNVQKVSLQGVEMLLEDQVAFKDENSEALLALDDALDKLAQRDPRAVQVVECKFFGGMTIEETAEIMGISPRTVIRDWALAQAWLHSEMKAETTR